MSGQILFTIIAFVLFLYILLFKFIKKNDTTYLTILVLEAIGIFMNLLRIKFNIFNEVKYTIIIYILCIAIPILVYLFEKKKINISERIRLLRAKFFKYFGFTKKSKEILNDLVKKYDRSYKGHRMLAEIYEDEGGMRKAIDEYVRVLETRKNDYDAYYRISVLLNELGRKDEAIEMLRVLLKSKPQDIRAIKLLGNIYMEQEEYKKTIEIFTGGLKYSIEDADIYYNLGICYTKTNDFNEAKQAFQKALEINKDIYLASYRLAQIALLYREYDIAEQYFLRSAFNEKEAKAYFELAKIYAMKHNNEQSKMYINKAISLNTKYYNLMQEEPVLFTIRREIERPSVETKNDEEESKQEKEIEEYLNNMYNLTKTLKPGNIV